MNIWNSVMVKGKETFTLFQRLERLWVAHNLLGLLGFARTCELSQKRFSIHQKARQAE